jgi:hypothetical protein
VDDGALLRWVSLMVNIATNYFKLSVVMLNVVMVSVMAPLHSENSLKASSSGTICLKAKLC